MKKIRIKFQIKSLDTDNSFVTNGELKNNRIIFTDNEENTNYIIFHNSFIEYHKKGKVDMKYKFEQNSTTKGYYSLEGYKLEFDIMTEFVLIQEGFVDIKYDLYQSNDLVNKTEIIIEYTFLKEE